MRWNGLFKPLRAMGIKNFNEEHMKSSGMVLTAYLRHLFYGAVIFGILVLLFAMSRYDKIKRARFGVDALSRYIFSYQKVSGVEVQSLAQLPEFVLFSQTDGYLLRAEDLRKRVYDGYFYDFQPVGEGMYVISASPVYPLSPKVEFGITEDGVLRANTDQVDALGDPHEEVSNWKPVFDSGSIRTWNPKS